MHDEMDRRISSLIEKDPYLKPYEPIMQRRLRRIKDAEHRLTQGKINLSDFASGHEYFGLLRRENGGVFREWAPNATAIYIIGDMTRRSFPPSRSLARRIRKPDTLLCP